MICYIKEIQGLLSTLTKKSPVFQGFQGLEKPVMNFKYFQALQGPVRTSPAVLSMDVEYHPKEQSSQVS